MSEIEVTRADRRVGWMFRPSCYRDEASTRMRWLAGVYDDCGGVPNKEIARHRHEAEAAKDREIRAARKKVLMLEKSHRRWIKRDDVLAILDELTGGGDE
jgi:hypothetical protein